MLSTILALLLLQAAPVDGFRGFAWGSDATILVTHTCTEPVLTNPEGIPVVSYHCRFQKERLLFVFEGIVPNLELVSGSAFFPFRKFNSVMTSIEKRHGPPKFSGHGTVEWETDDSLIIMSNSAKGMAKVTYTSNEHISRLEERRLEKQHKQNEVTE